MLPALKDESLIAELICDFSSGSDMGVSWPRAVVRRGGVLAGGGGGAWREEEVGRVLVPLELHGQGGLAQVDNLTSMMVSFTVSGPGWI